MNRARLKLILILAAFLGPLLAAFLWYYGLGAASAPREMSNHAPLLQPPIPLTPFTNPRADGSANFALTDLKGKWSILHPLTHHCTATCQQSLYHTRQTRLALGRRANRIRRILISPNRDLLNSLAAEHPDAVRLLHTGDGTGLAGQLIPLRERGRIGEDDAVLVDPLGNVMMVVPEELDPRLLLKDLKKLLKLSRIG